MYTLIDVCTYDSNDYGTYVRHLHPNLASLVRVTVTAPPLVVCIYSLFIEHRYSRRK